MIRLDAIELDDLLKRVGFTDAEKRRTAWAVAMRESSGTVDVIGGPNSNGSYDWGLFQINDAAHKGNVDWSRILDGEYNAGLAYGWTDGGDDWGAWALGETGWAGWLKEHKPAVWQQMHDLWKKHYDAYPAALKAALEWRERPGVVMKSLVPGTRAPSVKVYEGALHDFLGADADRVDPAGPTARYTTATKKMTRLAYKKVAAQTGDDSWLKGDLTTPGPSLVMRLGLRPLWEV